MANLGTIGVPYWEWWLHHHPFRRNGNTCPICQSDTSCLNNCPGKKIDGLLDKAGNLMHEWNTLYRNK
jgi:hypothetical protein